MGKCHQLAGILLLGDSIEVEKRIFWKYIYIRYKIAGIKAKGIKTIWKPQEINRTLNHKIFIRYMKQMMMRKHKHKKKLQKPLYTRLKYNQKAKLHDLQEIYNYAEIEMELTVQAWQLACWKETETEEPSTNPWPRSRAKSWTSTCCMLRTTL